METRFIELAGFVAMGIEAVMVLILVLGTIEALYGILQQMAARLELLPKLREVWLRFAAWIILALEFALAADLIRTVVAPSWDEVGKLAAIATIRTILSWFLSRDVAEFERVGTRTPTGS